MKFQVITLFPSMFDSYLKESIIGRAITDKKISVKFYNPRDYTENKWGRVDGRPYGGGPGMVMEAQPILTAIGKARGKKKTKVIIFSPAGKKLTNEYARNLLKKNKEIILVSGRYEGIDGRVKKILKAEEVSIGDYVLTGGELPAMVLIDTVARQIKGVLNTFDSVEENRISSSEVYTRPEILKYKGKNYKVPKVLLSGHQANIEKWLKQSREKRDWSPGGKVA